MRDIIADLKHWRKADKSVELATSIETRGSSLRPAGTRAAITKTGEITEPVSTACSAVAAQQWLLSSGCSAVAALTAMS